MKDKIISQTKSFLQELRNSFTSPALKSVLKIDFISLIIAALLIAVFLFSVSGIANSISNGMTSDQLGAAMLDAEPEELEHLLFQLKSLFLFLVILAPVMLAAISTIYGYSRQLIISKLKHTLASTKMTVKDFVKKKYIFRWLWLILLLTVIFAIIITLYLFVKYGVLLIFVMFMQDEYFWNQIATVMNTFLGVYLLFTIFTIEHELVKSNKTWGSISQGFITIFLNFKKVSLTVLTSIIILSLTNFIIIAPVTIYIGQMWAIICQAILAVLFISWSRVYLWQVLNKHEAHKHKETTLPKHHKEQE